MDRTDRLTHPQTSAALAAGALIKAFSQRPNYYSATVYLAQSNACVLILTNLALVCTVSFIYGLQRLLYGPLRPIEIEQLSEKAWYAVLDTLLAMPSLRDDVGGWLLVIFVLLLAGKVWGWIAEGRVDLLEQQPPQNPKLFHIRLASSLIVSVAFAAFMARYSLQSVLDNPRPGMMVIFTFEFAILTIFSLFTLFRYFLACYESHVTQLQTRQKVEERKAEIREERLQALRESGQEGGTIAEPTDDDVDENEVDVPGWEEKRRWLFGLELATDFVKIVVYTVFFTISLTFIGLPMHIMRDVYITLANFTKRIQDYSNYRRATSDMNSRYPDATAEELSQDNTCIVCREAMIPWDRPEQAQPEGQPRRRALNEGLRAKKLPCNHILHLRCLKAWLERQQACPTCRRPVIPRSVPQARDARGNLRPVGDILADAQRAQGQPGQVGQHGQPGQADGDAQQQAQQQQRRNRMRWLNMGPVRIGFYNGPADQVQEALRRQATNDQGTTAALRASTEHRLARRTAHLTNQDHLRSVELRLLEQAHNLHVEQAQLTHVRALEAELARLRSLRIEPGSSARAAAMGRSVAIGTGNEYSGTTIPPAQALQRYQAAPGASPLGSGDQNLPSGLVLPEGWTLTPLQRSDTGLPGIISTQLPTYDMIHMNQAPQPSASGASAPAPAEQLTNSTSSTAPAAAPAQNIAHSDSATEQASTASNAVTDPVPVDIVPEQVQAVSSSAPAVGVTPEPPRPSVPASPAASQDPPRNSEALSNVQPGHNEVGRTTAHPSSGVQENPSTPSQPAWASGPPAWSFDTDQASSSSTNGEPARPKENGSANGQTKHENASADTSEDRKGKGRSVEIEDVPDEEA